MPKQSTPCYANLASQIIDENGPGSILMDFEVLLGFIEEGVRSTGKYHLLPMARHRAYPTTAVCWFPFLDQSVELPFC